MDPYRKKSPGEYAQILQSLKENKEKQKQLDDIKNIRNGRIIIFVLAGFMALSGVVEYVMTEEIISVYIWTFIVAIYILMGALYYRDPYNISIVALGLYIGILLLAAAVDPTALVKGFIIKFIIISGLIRAIKYAKDYKVAVKQLDTGLLDDEFVDRNQ